MGKTDNNGKTKAVHEEFWSPNPKCYHCFLHWRILNANFGLPRGHLGFTLMGSSSDILLSNISSRKLWNNSFRNLFSATIYALTNCVSCKLPEITLLYHNSTPKKPNYQYRSDPVASPKKILRVSQSTPAVQCPTNFVFNFEVDLNIFRWICMPRADFITPAKLIRICMHFALAKRKR